MDEPLTFAAWLRGVLDQKGWRSAELARRLAEVGMPKAKSRISQWLNPPELAEADDPHLAKALGVTPEAIALARANLPRVLFAAWVRERVVESGLSLAAVARKMVTGKGEALAAVRAQYVLLNRWLSPHVCDSGDLAKLLCVLGYNIDDHRDTVLTVYTLCGVPIPVRCPPAADTDVLAATG